MSTHHLRFEPDDSANAKAALEAWTLVGCKRRPTQVERLVDFKHRRVYERARIFRLVAAGPRGEAVVAKGAPSRTLVTEALVYREVLPRLGLPGPECYGYLDDGDRSWLFIEEVRGEPFSHRSPAHLALAVRWFATLHTMSSRLPLADRLPPETPAAYRPCLNVARESILASSNTLPAPAKSMISALLKTLDRIEAAWDAASLHSAAMPHCLVHADFVNKNVLVTKRSDGDQLMALDWGIAGWGAPAPDLEYVDPAAYFALVRTTWPAIRISDVAALKTIGIVMRHLGLIEVWASSLRVQPEWAIERLAESAAILAQVAPNLPSDVARVAPVPSQINRAEEPPS
jgi:aminoglycoside phosphotransferase (APT) family kinase protein